MVTKRTTKTPAKIADDAPKAEPKTKPIVAGATSGVMAPGAVGKVARLAAHQQYANGGVPPVITPDRPRDR